MEEIYKGVFRICIPFESVYTTVLILTQGENAVIFDSGPSGDDAKKYILPEIEKIGKNVIYIVSSHNHSDHNGGMETLKMAFPKAKALGFIDQSVRNNEILLDRFKILSLKGHSYDSLGILDLKTETLYSADCLQLYGVDKYGGNFTNFVYYLESVKNLKNIKISNIIAAHDFIPYGYKAEGKNAVRQYLDVCEKAVNEIVEFVKLNKGEKSESIAHMFNERNPQISPISVGTVENILKLL